jgi:hypothetical protein
MPLTADHYRQREFFRGGALPFLFSAAAATMVWAGWDAFPVDALLILCGLVLLFCAIGATLCVIVIEGDGEQLLAYYCLAKSAAKRVRYADIESVELDKLTVLDGFGIRSRLSGGWICNPGRRKCVVIYSRGLNVLGGRSREATRVGTSDPENLLHFLQGRMGPVPATNGERV